MGDLQKPNLDVSVSVAPGGSNIRTTAVMLPQGLAADLKQVPRACRQADWDAGTCSADAVMGTVEGRLAITDEVLTGTLSMVRIDGRTLPSMGIQFGGSLRQQAARRDRGRPGQRPTGHDVPERARRAAHPS
ncbi:MAG: hypothetical protein PGN13_13830 [Patulibacter minatonensis]